MSVFDKIHTGVLSCLETRITQNPKWLKFKKPNIQVTIKLRGAGILYFFVTEIKWPFLFYYFIYYCHLAEFILHNAARYPMNSEEYKKKKLLDPKMQHVKISGFKYKSTDWIKIFAAPAWTSNLVLAHMID